MQIQQSPVEQQSEDSSATAAKEETSKAWRVVTRKRKEVKREDEDEEEEEEEHYFDFVMLCSGVYSKPYTPGNRISLYSGTYHLGQKYRLTSIAYLR